MTERTRPNGAQKYNGNGNHEWEAVTTDGCVRRLRVPGGWLYGARESYAYDFGGGMVFVPVPEVVGYAV